ncbi:MAG TPA: glycosyltransferase family 4 protein [Thermodesulfobacteriota bacterium]|nr:glycosyltransferase family 4 protein [Thermodesulfobacteriota bacterium]
MNISICIPKFFMPASNPDDQHLFQALEALGRSGMDITLFTFAPQEPSLPHVLNGEEPQSTVRTRQYLPRRIRIRSLPEQYHCRTLLHDLLNQHADLIHFFDFTQLSLLWALTRKKPCPLVVTPAAGQELLPPFSLLRKTFCSLMVYCTSNVSCFLADTPEKRKGLIELGIAKEKIAHLVMNTDYPAMSSLTRQEEPVILTIGRYDPGKGLHILVDAAAEVLDHHPETIFYVVGTIHDNAYYRQLRKKIRGQEERIRFTGPLQQEDLLKLFSRAQLFVLPSVNDPRGLIILDAMAAGIPVVASRIEGLSSLIVDGEDGVLVPPGDASSLSTAILDLLENGDKRTSLVQKGRQTAANCYWKSYAETVSALYQRIIEHEHQSVH